MTLHDYISALKSKRVAVIGIGVSNLPLIRLLCEEGCDVTACDKRTAEQLGEVYVEFSTRGVKFQLGENYLENLDFDVVFRTPGLHPFALKAA